MRYILRQMPEAVVAMASLARAVRSGGRWRAAGMGVALVLAAGFLAARGGVAGAQPVAEDCERAAWPLAADRALLSAPDPRRVTPGDTLVLPLDGALRLGLVPQVGANLPVPPRRGDGGTFAGVMDLKVPPPERVWQVTVSANAWIDVVVDGRPLTPIAFTGVHACPGLRKSLRFGIPSGDVRLQVSGVEGAWLDLVITPAD
ncbi:UNVERIFIED_ORG: hypothetical protein ABID33_001141 [Xanthobacter viscosus]|uniref:Uncharacterized protein n=1 Tax=Xanthobacter autotrophicus TaxID=280 RepID=A0A6C1KF76_XANAU|nr:hypothetical protein [Xanthobacter autotrophicus]TLX42938.1 hypothetical protein FBQ73_09770 [Xanthobacter autotrophicus]